MKHRIPFHTINTSIFHMFTVCSVPLMWWWPRKPWCDNSRLFRTPRIMRVLSLGKNALHATRFGIICHPATASSRHVFAHRSMGSEQTGWLPIWRGNVFQINHTHRQHSKWTVCQLAGVLCRGVVVPSITIAKVQRWLLE